MRDDLGIGIALEAAPARGQRLAQRPEILDDAVVDERHLTRRVRVGVVRRRRAVRRPACVGDADGPRRRMRGQFLDESAQLAFGPTADQFAALDRADARRVITAIFHPPESVDKAVRHGGLADNSDDSAHGRQSFYRV